MQVLLSLCAAFALAACGDKPSESKVAATVLKPAPSAEVMPVAPAAKAAEAVKPDGDAQLAAKVKKAIESDKELAGQGIDVTASGGVVRLWGTVATAGELKRATQVASSIAGVTSVNNQLAIVKGS